MKISFEKKIILGFIINLLVVFASGWIYISLLNRRGGQPFDSRLEWIGLSLFFISVVLLTIVYFIIRAQMQARNVSEGLLLENKILLQSIIDNTSNPIFIKKLNGEYILVNKQYGNLFQISNEKIIGKTDHDFLPQATADTYRNSDLEAIKAQKEVKVEETIQQSDGPHTYIAVKFPLYDAAGRVYAVGGISTDITERKHREEFLQAGDKFFNMSLDIMVIASKENFLKINPTMSKILGYSNEELMNQSFFKYIYKNDIEITKQEIEKLGKGIPTIKFENRWVCKDGSHKLLSWSATPDISTGLLYAIATDITQEKENQKTLIQADRFFNMAFDIFFLAKGESIVKINPSLTRIFGFELKDYFNKSFLSFVHPDDLKITTDEVKKLRAGASVISFKVRSICKDGTYKWIVWSATSDPQTGMIFAAGRDVTALVEYEESIKIADNFFEMSFDPFIVSKGTQIIKINPAFTKTLGYDLKDLEKKSILDLVHPDYLNIAKERIAKRFEGADVENDVTYPVICKDGSYKWMEAMITTNVKAGIIYLVLEDISEKKKNEETLKLSIQKLKDNEKQIQTIFDCAPDPVIVIDNESNVLQWNTKAESLFGWKIAEVLGKPMYEFVVPNQYREMHKKGMEKFIETGIGPILNKTTEIAAVNKEGTEFPVALSISATKMGEKNIFIGFVRDITEDKKVLNELHEQEEMLRLVLGNIAEGVIVTDANKNIVMSNEIADKVFGMQKDEQILPNLIDHFDLYYPDESTVFPSQNLPMNHAMNGELMEDVDLVLYDPTTREKKRVLMSGRPLINQDNKVVAVVVTIKDISRYKQMEAKLKEAEIKYRQVIGFNKSNER